MSADETRQSDEKVTLTPEERTALNRALRGDVREYLLEWVVYPAIERIVAERLAVARCEVAARTLRGQRDFFLAIDMPVAADHCEQSATGWESQAVTDALRIRPGGGSDA